MYKLHNKNKVEIAYEQGKENVYKMPYTKNFSGITLIALVVTIVVLLILASITLNYTIGDNGIIKEAQKTKDEVINKTENAEQDSQNLIEKIAGEERIDGVTRTIPEGLKVGSTVIYTPVHDSDTSKQIGTYIWKADYYSSDDTDTNVTLDNTNSDYAITTWKVLEIDETEGKVTLVPSVPTMGTVKLYGAQGYNNAVKLLNDACSALYSNSNKGIIARSINIEDIEKYLTDTALSKAHSYQYASDTAKYGEKIQNAYTTCNYYSAIYELEKQSVINGTEKANGLTSSEQTDFISKTQSSILSTATTTNATSGYFKSSTSIQPYQTYYQLGANATNFESLPNESVSTTNNTYYDLLMSNDINTYYWIATRCMYTNAKSRRF